MYLQPLAINLNGIYRSPETVIYTLQKLSNPLNKPLKKTLLAPLLEGISIRLQIHLMQLYKLGPLNDLPTHKHNQHNRQFHIKAHETDAVKSRAEAGPPLHEHDHDVENYANPGPDWVCEVTEG